MITSALLTSAGDSFVALFTEMTALVYVLFILGFILCLVEAFTPGFGFAGSLGGIALISAIVVRMLQGGDAWMLLYMVLICTTLAVVALVLVARSIKQGRLSKSNMFNVDSSVPTGVTEGTKDYTSLVGATGTTISMLRPVGQADIGGAIVDVVANTSFVDSGVAVEVIAVEGGIVRVNPTK